MITTTHHDAVRQHLVEKGEASIVLHMILFDSEAREALHEFLQKEFALENLIFYESVEGIKMLADQADPENSVRFFDAFDVIMHRFIRKNANEEINIPQQLKDDLLAIHKKPHKSAPQCLRAIMKAQKEIVEMIAGCLPRFEVSEQFKDYLDYSSRKSQDHQAHQKHHQHPFHTAGIAHNIKHIHSLDICMPPNIMVHQKEKVLIVEHNSMVGKLLVRFLQPRYEVTLATTGGAALELLLVDHHYDTVLISIEQLEDRSGIDVIVSYLQMNSYLGQLRRNKADATGHKTTIIGMANERHHKTEVQALASGFDSVIIKPFSLDDFRNAKGERHRVISRIHHFLETPY